MSQTYGVTPAGFVAKPQSVIQSEIQDSLRNALGININLLPEAVIGQLVGVFAEREGLLWQGQEGVYASTYPSGAEGASVDNILALNNLRRLPASSSRTADTLAGIPGLVLMGTPGTVIPAGSIIQVLGNLTAQFATNASATIAAAANAVQNMIFSILPNTGSFKFQIADPNDQNLLTALIGPLSQASITSIQYFGGAPTSGAYTLTLTCAGVALTTGSLAFGATAANIQTAIRALAGYSGVNVTAATVGGSPGFAIDWGTVPNPLVTVATNTTGITINALQSIQGSINNLYDTAALNYPYTDVRVTGSYSLSLNFNFGAGTPVGSNPASGSMAQDLITIPINTLQDTGSGTFCNISVANTTVGTPAQAIVSATALATGPTYAPAGSLTVIGSPISGWTSVNNPLDVIVGTNIETDTDALARRLTLLAAQANGPIQAIVQKVRLVPNVSAAIGFENTTNVVAGGGRPGKSFEVVALGGTDQAVAQAIYNSKPAGIQSYGSTSVVIVDAFGKNVTINFSRPTSVPIYVVIAMVTDITSSNPKFSPGSIQKIQSDIIAIGNATPIGGLIVGMGSNGLIGAFNNIPGIISYTLSFGTSPNPVTSTNIQLTAEQLAVFETFNVTVSYT